MRTFKIQTPTFTDEEKEVIEKILEDLVERECGTFLFGKTEQIAKVETEVDCSNILMSSVKIVARNYSCNFHLFESMGYQEKSPSKKVFRISTFGKIYFFSILPFLEGETPNYEIIVEAK